MCNEIHRFYVVTESRSLYRVSDELDLETKVPIVEKIALLGNSRCHVGTRFGGGSLVGITPHNIQLFNTDKHNHTAFYVSTSYWGGGTSAIIGLFEDENEARKCLNSTELRPWDPRWGKETDKVLLRIGSRHPVFRPEPEVLRRVGIVDPG